MLDTSKESTGAYSVSFLRRSHQGSINLLIVSKSSTNRAIEAFEARVQLVPLLIPSLIWRSHHGSKPGPPAEKADGLIIGLWWLMVLLTYEYGLIAVKSGKTLVTLTAIAIVKSSALSVNTRATGTTVYFCEVYSFGKRRKFNKQRIWGCFYGNPAQVRKPPK